MGYARASVMIDITHSICSSTKVNVNGTILWQKSIYEDLPDICYTYGRITIDQGDCGCSLLPENLRDIQVYGPWIRMSRVPMVNQSSETTRETNQSHKGEQGEVWK
ncbi:hypothetical protein COCNU_10G007920 [Cocos nucifera]|uniref:Uncharacterized protein n=1 Tax=Cocos nucifera TaxID=13894 RepID=A0A8K0N8G3_COCNU|nr:hypothetical protein COCNU_10G007920 [Cocos nucifera]